MTASINVFQRLFQSWEAVHPYNAAQVVRWRGGVCPQRAWEAWEGTLGAMGLGRVRIKGREVLHESLNGELKLYPVRVLSPSTDFQTFLGEELNRPFTDPDEPPFRPFLLPREDSTWLGVVYRHWVADSVSIRLLLREWCERLAAGTQRINGATRHATAPYWDLFGSRYGRAEMGHTLLSLWRAHQRLRTALKVQSLSRREYDVRVLLRDTPTGLIDAVRRYARTEGVTVGDVFLAALADSTASHVPMQHRPSRRDLAVGNVVDLRPFAGRDLSHTFGLYLGFMHMVFRPSELTDWRQLLHSVHRQARARRVGVAQASTIWSAAALTAQRWMRPDQIYHFYRKEMPLAAGLSNVNLAGTWAEERHPESVLDYLRISPTGPTAPAVLSSTTLGSRLQLGLTYRNALLTEPQAAAMLRHFVDRLADASGFAR